jgi:hypothetical protein
MVKLLPLVDPSFLDRAGFNQDGLAGIAPSSRVRSRFGSQASSKRDFVEGFSSRGQGPRRTSGSVTQRASLGAEVTQSGTCVPVRSVTELIALIDESPRFGPIAPTSVSEVGVNGLPT